MDLTIEEPDERAQNRRRGRMAYFEEDEQGNATSAKPVPKNIQPPSKLGIAMRYNVYWTQVAGRRKVQTFMTTLDIDPHLMVVDVIDMALRQLNKTVKDPAAKATLQHPPSKWEMRFSGNDGLPRFDYPCRV